MSSISGDRTNQEAPLQERLLDLMDTLLDSLVRRRLQEYTRSATSVHVALQVYTRSTTRVHVALAR